MYNFTFPRPMRILLIEDNPGDIRLTKEALRIAKMPNLLRVIEDGVEAMTFLFGPDKLIDQFRPDLIILDLNLPRKDGRDILIALKTDPTLKRIPIIIFTTSQAEPDVIHAYEMHANCFITKPMDYEQFIAVARAIESFWLTVVRLPN
jgi:CheY-like chemotaxis protein